MIRIFMDFDQTASWIAPVVIERMLRYLGQRGLASYWDEAYPIAAAAGFSLQGLARALQEHSGQPFDAAELASGLDHALFDDLPDTLYPDVEPAIVRWRSKGYEVRLLTRGDPAWQKRKIWSTRLPEILGTDEMLFVHQEAKAEVMARLVQPGDRVLFLDDAVRELDTAAAWSWPAGVICKTYRVDRRAYVPAGERSHVKWQEIFQLCAEESAYPHQTITSFHEMKREIQS